VAERIADHVEDVALGDIRVVSDGPSPERDQENPIEVFSEAMLHARLIDEARVAGRAAVEHELKPALSSKTTAMPVEPPEARHASININSIAGGQPGGGFQTPCVADRCQAIFDRRFLLEEPLEEVRSQIREILNRLARQDPEFRYQLSDLLIVQPIQTDANSQLVTTMAAAVRDVLGVQPPLIASPGTYDQKHVMRLGLVEQCIAYGPGILHLSHQPDEYCRIDHLVDGAKAMALAAMRLLGAE